VNELQGGYLVAVIGSDNKVNIRPIKVGVRIDTMWIVEEGLKPGDRIIAEGFQKVREGMQVQPEPYQSGSETKKSEAKITSP
jgi:membrane fusion protein (multidrug efflux system)